MTDLKASSSISVLFCQRILYHRQCRALGGPYSARLDKTALPPGANLMPVLPQRLAYIITSTVHTQTRAFEPPRTRANRSNHKSILNNPTPYPNSISHNFHRADLHSVFRVISQIIKIGQPVRSGWPILAQYSPLFLIQLGSHQSCV